MKLVITLFDAKTESHSPFGMFKTIEEAKRTLVISLRGAPDIPPAQFPEDFSLCCVGSFDESTRDNPYSTNPLHIIGSVASIIKEVNPYKFEPSKESSTVEKKETKLRDSENAY